MALKEITKRVRVELKKEFPGHKFSVRTLHGTEISIALMTAPKSPFANLNTADGQTHSGDYAQLNHYHIEQDWNKNWVSNGYYLTEQGAKMFKKVSTIGNRENWDESDIQTDYFNVNYYISLAVGQWDRPFAVR